MKIKEPVELYIHIPFCIKKCNYCDFLSYSAECDERERYVEALLQQIRTVGWGAVPGTDPEEFDSDEDEDEEHKFAVSTVYIGGGTPTVLSAEQIDSILCQLKESFDILPDAEITIEANPGTVSYEKLESIRKSGVNRLSLGLQSASMDELKMLGRIHSYEEFFDSYVNARKAGFDNINVDIMTALPGQTKEILEDTLNKVIALSPEHISAYSLIIEEDTPFYEQYGEIEGPVIGEEAERELYYYVTDRLREAGYQRYEISNYARPGFESRHNCGYWNRTSYFGLGLGASSFFVNFRVTNTESMHEYLKNPSAFESCQRLSDNDAMEEFMYLGLRMSKGVSKSDFEKMYKVDFDTVYGRVIDKLLRDDLIMQDGDRICLTDKGIDYGNFAFSQFLL